MLPVTALGTSQTLAIIENMREFGFVLPKPVGISDSRTILIRVGITTARPQKAANPKI
jgi:hypothetical protein